ncbi:MAG TPA: ExeM/NucH family extracellular endonuclease [Gammaproteobacteria bacterium]|nr:ExeM/NucH family extracellular endonuclease [Gammaproteobacteria bacterium]
MIKSTPNFRYLATLLVLLLTLAGDGFRTVLAIGACGDVAIFIHDIQGTGLASSKVGKLGEIEGIVVGDFRDGLGGFFVQEEDADADSDALSSEGIFVYHSADAGPTLGDIVRVRGQVREFHDLTELDAVEAVIVCGKGAAVTPARLTLPLIAVDRLEALEGMAVVLPQTLYLSEYHDFARFNEILLSKERQYQPTQMHRPDSVERERLAQTNSLGRILLDDGRRRRKADPPIHPDGRPFDANNRFRGGDTVVNVTGVLDQAFGSYRIQPTRGAGFTVRNPRPPKPPGVGGSLRVAAFNLRNYFTTLDGGGAVCGPASNRGCRGAGNAFELKRQRIKIIGAILALDADIVGLIEIENHPRDTALSDLVAGLNAAADGVGYRTIDTGAIGSDTIKVALIYRPSAVSPVGNFAILDKSVDSGFDDSRNRPVLAQTFEEKESAQRFTVAVNHLKSKGSACDDLGDPDTGDGQGNCNLTRKSALRAEVAWLATDPTGGGDPDFLLIGDLNSYAREDPVGVLREHGYSDLVDRFLGDRAYSYLFAGTLGYLDHALASPTLANQVTGVTIWHANVDEPDILDYQTRPGREGLYVPDPFRASDHDPLLIGLELRRATGD